MPLRVTKVEVTTPPYPSGALVAWAWVQIEDEAGIGFTIRDLRVVRVRDEIKIIMPNAPRMAKCSQGECRGRNSLKACYCNWCGQPLVPSEHSQYDDFVGPISYLSRMLIQEAVLGAYRKSRPVGVAVGGPDSHSKI